jgi:hypothetical protein
LYGINFILSDITVYSYQFAYAYANIDSAGKALVKFPPHKLDVLKPFGVI